MAAGYVESLGRGMRFRREQLGLSRSEVARKLPGKTNENAIYRWEGGQHKPADDTLEALAVALEVEHWTRFMDLDPERDEPEFEKAPDPFGGDATPAARAMFESIEQRVLSQLAAHAHEVESQLTDQSATLAEMQATLADIRTGIAEEQAARKEAEDARRRAEEATKELRGLLDVLAVAIPTLAAGAPPKAAKRGPRAK